MSLKNLLSIKNIRLILCMAACLLALWIGLYFRLYPLRTFTPDQSTEKATLLVLAHLRSNVNDQVEKQHPKLSKEEKDAIKKKLFDKMLHDESKNVRTAIDNVSQNIKNSQNTSSQKPYPYLLESDSFHFFGLTKRIEEKGSISNEIKASKYFNEMMIAPKGHWEPISLHPYIGFYVYKIISLFNSKIDMMFAVSFTPLIIIALTIIPFILISTIYQINPAVSFTGLIFFLLAPISIQRTSFGWYDNDPYNILFPLLILSTMFLGYTFTYDRRKSIIIGLLLSLFVLLYALFWQGWVFIFTIIIITAVILSFASVLFRLPERKNIIVFFLTAITSSFLLITLIFGIKEFFVLFSEGWRALQNFLTPQLSLWPDLFLSVSELKKSSLEKMIEISGGNIFFYVSTIGIVIAFAVSYFQKNKNEIFAIITISVFLFISLILSLGAQRFSLLCLVPLTMAFIFSLNTVFKAASLMKLNQALLKPAVYSVISLTVAACSLIPVNYMIKSNRSYLNPIYNEVWNVTLNKIKSATPEDSIINSWWTPGHFIKSMAERRVTFDGATINFPQAYWMSNIFLSQTEKEAAGILRMLNTSANDAVDYLTALGFPLSTSVQILKSITPLSEFNARMVLKNILKDSKQLEKLLSLTHGNPPPSYLLIFDEMVEGNLQFSFFGNWNFKKIEEINKNPDLLKKVPNRNSDDYVKFLWSLAGGPYQYSGPLSLISKKGSLAYFEHNLTVDMDTKECIMGGLDNIKIPLSIFYVKDGRINEQKFEKNNIPFSILLYETSNALKAIILDRRLAQSILMRLYFFDAAGMKYFKPFISESDLTGRTKIKVFKIDWDQFKADLEI